MHIWVVASTTSDGKINRWFVLQTASIGSQYRVSRTSKGGVVADQLRYQVTFKGRFKFDGSGRLSLNASLSTGSNFNAGWNRTGWGNGRAQTNLFLKQLYLTARPAQGAELAYGGLDIPRDESTDITSYSYEGYVMGERIRLNRPRELFFDEVSVTYGYLGDLNSSGVNKRFRRLAQSNFHRFILAKQIGERARASADYTFESGVETTREAIRVRLPELWLIDRLHFETYQVIRKRTGYGLAVYGERPVHPRVRIGGGYSQIDRHMLNSERYGEGERVFLTSHLTVSPVLTVMAFFTRGVASNPPSSPRNRFELILSYDLLRHLKRTGIF